MGLQPGGHDADRQRPAPRDASPVVQMRLKVKRRVTIVVEVATDVAWSGSSFRHPLCFVRYRPDVSVDDVGAARSS